MHRKQNRACLLDKHPRNRSFADQPNGQTARLIVNQRADQQGFRAAVFVEENAFRHFRIDLSGDRIHIDHLKKCRVVYDIQAGAVKHIRRALGGLLGELRVREDRLGHGQTTILVTHDLEFAEGCAGRWALLAKPDASGQTIIARGTPEAVMADEGALHQAGLHATQLFRLRQALEGS